jgi:putative transposase
MTAQRRKFTEDEKMHILHLAKQTNISKVLRDYQLSYSVFSRWKQQIEGSPSISSSNEDLINLRNENTRLKRIIAEQALELEIKREMERK